MSSIIVALSREDGTAVPIVMIARSPATTTTTIANKTQSFITYDYKINDDG